MLRAPLVLVATSELVKLRFVVLQQSQAEAPDAFGYFFWLYCAYVGVQVWVVLHNEHLRAAVAAALHLSLCVLAPCPWPLTGQQQRYQQQSKQPAADPDIRLAASRDWVAC